MGERSARRRDEPPDEPNVAVAVLRDMPETERRRLLTAIGGAGVTVLAGCIGDDAPAEDDVTAYEVVFLDQEVTVEVREDEPVLDPALDAGVDIPYSCEVGTCGQCTARYDSDANEVVTHDGNDYLTDAQIEDGWVLTCVAYPEDDFELEVAHPDDE